MKPLLVASIAKPAQCAFCTRPAVFVWAVIGRHSFPVCTTDQKRLSRWAELRSAALGPVGTAEEAAAAFPDLLELSAQLWDDLVAAFTREETASVLLNAANRAAHEHGVSSSVYQIAAARYADAADHLRPLS